MSSQSPPAEGSDTEQSRQADNPEKEDGEEVVGVRESADGGASPQQPTHPESPDEDNESPKERSGDPKDLDKDIDAVLEHNVQNGQIDPNFSVTIDGIPVDSTLDSTRNLPDEEESGADGMPSVRHDGGEQPIGANVDVNGNVETAQGGKETSDRDDFSKAKETGSDKSFTSDTDSSVVAETLVRNALNVAVTAMKSDDTDSVVKDLNENQNETNDGVTVSDEPPADVKVGLFQYNFGDDYQAENGGYEDEYSDEKEDEPDEKEEKKESDPQVGLFQYHEPSDMEKSKSPDVSEIETVEDQIESMTEEERADIMTLYGLDNVEPISPKSPTESDMTRPETKGQEEDRFIDVQREVYEPQTKKFIITRDPSSSESTPRNGTDNAKTELIPAEVIERPTSQGIEKEIKDILSDREEQGLSDSGTKKAPERLESRDDKPSPYIDHSSSTDIAPPLVQYEPVKENGKFRIVKTSKTKEGGGSSYSTIRVGTPEQSPRSGSEDSQKSDRSQSGASAAGIDMSQRLVQSPPTQVAQNMQQVQNLNTEQGKWVKETNRYQDRLPVAAEEGESLSLASSLRSQNGERRDTDEALNTDLNNSWKSKPAVAVIKEGVNGRPRDTSPKQMSVSELHSTSEERLRTTEAERDRIKYRTRNTDGVETRRTGPVPYDVTQDQQTAGSRLPEGHYLQSYNKERYESLPGDPTNRFSTSYKEELIQSAYSRLPNTQDVHSKSLPGRIVVSGVIPGFKTLQEQQASWSGMFRQLEDQHRRELRSQYDHHQYNIQRLQQEMELELQKQHLAIRKKLDLHREKLDQMASPEREALSQGRRYRSDDKSHSPERGQRSADGSRERSQSIEADNFVESKTWREIYREVRAEEEKDDSASPPPLKRSLDEDFATLDSSVNDTRASRYTESSRSRPSQYSARSGERDHSDDRSRSRERSYERSRDRSLEMSRADSERSRTGIPEKDLSRSSEKDSRSRSYRSSVSPRYERDEAPQTIGQVAAESVSGHIQQLLDNLQDTRTSLRNIEGDISQERDTSQDRPRAGVYSSPMPVFKGRGAKSSPKSAFDIPKNGSTSQERRSADQSGFSLDQSRVSANQSRLSSLFGDRAELHEDSLYSKSERQRKDKERLSESLRGEDLSLSSRERLNLREKHSKHLADLRAYYEDELRDLRKALTDSLDSTQVSADMSVHSAVQGHLLEAENKHLLDKCRTMEDELEELYARARTLEQKNHGLEKRASEYAGAFTESQTMAIQHQAHIEELQRYCRERDNVITDLESKINSQEDSVKIYKKSLDEELELHRQDKIALQRIIDKYESLEREYKLLQETMSTTETRLYEARTEVVELNRAISKMELENKRIGRENDNLRHKITQSLNLSALHESFGSPSSPRSVGVGQTSPGNTGHNKSPSSYTASALSSQPRQAEASSPDKRLPGFATSTLDWSTTKQSQRMKLQNQSKYKPSAAERTVASGRQGSSDSLNSSQMKGESSKSKRRVESKGNNSSRSRAPREDGGSRNSVQNRQEHMNGDLELLPTRDVSPPARDHSPAGAPSEESLPDSDMSDFSPLLKAERELFKLRDMMRQAVAVKPTESPPEPKLQKKFYGSERPASKDDYHPDLGSVRGRKEKPTVNSHAVVPKTKSATQQSKSDKTADRASKKSYSSKPDKNDRSSDRSAGRPKDTRERIGDEEDKRAVTPTKKHFSVNSDVYGSPTRFDININDDRKSVSVSQRKMESEASKPKTSMVSRANQTREETPGANADRGDNHASGAEGHLESTLDRVRGGQYMTRPEWENIFTSLTKPRPESQDKVKAMTKEEKIKDRLKTISEMESRYDGLQIEKRQLESSLNKIPLHGRVDRNNRRQKEEIENRLDTVEKELGSLRMSLKRYNVLKTAG